MIPGKATLQPSSEEQLNNIAEILKAYPNVHVKIGGYTDNTGDAAANKALSEARAKNVMDALVAKGVDASRMESEGYGDQHPVGDNSTEEGRAEEPQDCTARDSEVAKQSNHGSSSCNG